MMMMAVSGCPDIAASVTRWDGHVNPVSFGRMAETQHLSRAAYDRLQQELEELTTFGRVDIARKIETARELGDLSENGDYHAAKEEQGKMQGRILHLQAILENHEIVEAESGGTVVPGSIVTIRYEGDDDT